MARMYSRKKGKSGSHKPTKKAKKSWVIHSAKEVEKLVVKLAKTGLTSAQLGLALRDTYGIPDVRTITKKKIDKILKENKLSKKIPEDLLALIKKDITLTKHRETHKKDMTVKRGQQLTLSKINRLSKYYKSTGKLPEDWKYDSSKAKLLLE
ncbi:MAG: 30S ribosomal protein S15 [Candidatus Woesearchaeota archaeon]